MTPREHSATAYWPLFAALVGLAATMLWIVTASTLRTDGHFVYVLDDAYIHMAVARSLAEHGVWGIDSERFAAASSSPLWTVLLAGSYRLFGVHPSTSLTINVLSAVALLSLVARLAANAGLTTWRTAAVLMALLWFTPLPVLAMGGMEHTVQIVVDVAFLACTIELLVSDASPRLSSLRIGTWLLAALATSIRYEGVFLAFTVVALLVLRRRWHDAIAVVAFAAIPIVLFGAYSLAHGGFVLPNSVLIKAGTIGTIPDSLSVKSAFHLVSRIPALLPSTAHLLVLLIASSLLLVTWLRRGILWTAGGLWNLAFIVVTLFHLQFAGIGFFYRYEAYLVALGIVAAGLTSAAVPAPTPKLSPSFKVAYLVALFFAGGLTTSPLIWRAYVAISDTPKASANVFQQQYQMGLFVRQFYPSDAVGVNDIGAVSFLSPAKVIDFAGLADMETARAIRGNRMDAGFVETRALQDRMRVAIVYDEWFRGRLPSTWQRIGEWTIPDKTSVAGDTVSFYAPGPEEVDRLTQALRSFSPMLPGVVKQRGEYTEASNIR